MLKYQICSTSSHFLINSTLRFLARLASVVLSVIPHVVAGIASVIRVCWLIAHLDLQLAEAFTEIDFIAMLSL